MWLPLTVLLPPTHCNSTLGRLTGESRQSMTNQPAQWIIPSLPQTLTVQYAPTHKQINMQVIQMNVHTNMVLKHILQWAQKNQLSLLIFNIKTIQLYIEGLNISSCISSAFSWFSGLWHTKQTGCHQTLVWPTTVCRSNVGCLISGHLAKSIWWNAFSSYTHQRSQADNTTAKQNFRCQDTIC